MRFAAIATSIIAVAATPFAIAAAGPQMSSDQFVSAVRCTAYRQVVDPRANLGAVRMQLNAEARRQPSEAVAVARAEVAAVAREASGIANAGEAAMMGQERASACADASWASDAGSQSV